MEFLIIILSKVTISQISYSIAITEVNAQLIVEIINLFHESSTSATLAR